MQRLGGLRGQVFTTPFFAAKLACTCQRLQGREKWSCEDLTPMPEFPRIRTVARNSGEFGPSQLHKSATAFHVAGVVGGWEAGGAFAATFRLWAKVFSALRFARHCFRRLSFLDLLCPDKVHLPSISWLWIGPGPCWPSRLLRRGGILHDQATVCQIRSVRPWAPQTWFSELDAVSGLPRGHRLHWRWAVV
jgi:hypothetical protein